VEGRIRACLRALRLAVHADRKAWKGDIEDHEVNKPRTTYQGSVLAVLNPNVKPPFSAGRMIEVKAIVQRPNEQARL